MVVTSRCFAFRGLTRKHKFEKVFEFKTRQGYFIYPFLRRLKLGKSLQTSCVGGLGEFSTVMQTPGFVSGLHNCFEFSQSLSCLYQAMQTRETFSVA